MQWVRLRRSSVCASVADRLVPVVLEPLGDAGGVVVGVGDRLAFDGDGVLQSSLVDGAVFLHGIEQHRVGAALEPQVLGVGGVQVLLPQAGGGRVRRVLVDGLVVVADDLGLREGLVLPVHALVLELLLVGGLVVGPVEDHAGLAGVDGAVGHVDGGQVAGLLELLEEVKAGLQVVDVATGELVGIR